MCVSRSLTFCLETKNAMAPNPLTKEESRRVLQLTTSACQDQLNTEFSKVCEKFKIRGIESLKYVREFYTPVCYCGDISTHLNMTRHKMKHDWLLYLSVIWPLWRALAIQSGQSSQTLIPRLGSCRALWCCTETAIWTFNPLTTTEVHYMEKIPGIFKKLGGDMGVSKLSENFHSESELLL